MTKRKTAKRAFADDIDERIGHVTKAVDDVQAYLKNCSS